MPRRLLRRSNLAVAFVAALLASGYSCSAKDNPPELTVKPHCRPDGSLDWAIVGGKKVEWLKGTNNLDTLKSALGDERKAVRMVADTTTPYRCIGGLIFSLQRLGVSKVGFISQPPLGRSDKSR